VKPEKTYGLILEAMMIIIKYKIITKINNKTTNVGKQQKLMRNIFVVKTNVFRTVIGRLRMRTQLATGRLRHRYLLTARGLADGMFHFRNGLYKVIKQIEVGQDRTRWVTMVE
jgi:hypothetical protein